MALGTTKDSFRHTWRNFIKTLNNNFKKVSQCYENYKHSISVQTLGGLSRFYAGFGSSELQKETISILKIKPHSKKKKHIPYTTHINDGDIETESPKRRLFLFALFLSTTMQYKEEAQKFLLSFKRKSFCSSFYEENVHVPLKLAVLKLIFFMPCCWPVRSFF